MTPASPNTYVISRQPSASEGFTREPVIGYVFSPADNKPPTVVTLQGQRRLIGGDAVLFPCGHVVDPLNGYSFASSEEWLEFNPGKSETRIESQKRPEDRESSVNTEGYDIEWTTATFKNNSFWHYDDGHFEFGFILPGEEPAPKQTEKVKKIKRVELDELKKSIDILSLDAVKSPKTLPNASPEEEEPSGDNDGEDEDNGGLI